jgi:hypothetical protein
METRKERTGKKRAEWRNRIIHRIVCFYEANGDIKDPVERFRRAVKEGENFVRYLIKSCPQEKSFYQSVELEAHEEIKNIIKICAQPAPKKAEAPNAMANA